MMKIVVKACWDYEISEEQENWSKEELKVWGVDFFKQTHLSKALEGTAWDYEVKVEVE